MRLIAWQHEDSAGLRTFPTGLRGGWPVIAARTEAAEGMMCHLANVLFASTENEWIHSAAVLIESEELRHRIGSAARNTALTAERARAQGMAYLRAVEAFRGNTNEKVAG